MKSEVDSVDVFAELPVAVPRVQNKSKVEVNDWLRDFLKHTDLIFLSTIDTDLNPLISPRGGPAGFVSLKGDTLYFVEDDGNNLRESCHAASVNPSVGLVAIVSGIPEVVRLQGLAKLKPWIDKNGRKSIIWSIRINKWYYHCGRAVKKSDSMKEVSRENLSEQKRQLRAFVRNSDSYVSVTD